MTPHLDMTRSSFIALKRDTEPHRLLDTFWPASQGGARYVGREMHSR